MNVMNGNGLIIFVDLCFSHVCIMAIDVFLHVWWLVSIFCKHMEDVSRIVLNEDVYFFDLLQKTF